MNKQKIARRKFMLESFLGLGAISLLSTSKPSINLNNTQEKANRAYLTESGNLGEDEFFGVGCLVANNYREHEAAIQQMRRKFGYRTQLSYGSTDRFRLEFLEAVLTYLAETGDMKFMYSLNPGEPKIKTKAEHPSFRKVLEARNEYFEVLLSSAALQSSNTEVQYKVKTAFGPSRYAMIDFRERTGMELVPSSALRNDLLQLSGLITATFTAMKRGNVGSPGKLQTLDLVQKATGVRTIKKNKHHLGGRLQIV